MPKAPTIYLSLSESVASKVEEALGNFKCRLILIPDGEKLIEISRKDPPDLIIIEKEIPKLDGYAVVLLLKNDPKTAEVPVIGICKCLTDAEAEKARDAGCDDYVCYPFEKEEFQNLVKKHLAR